MGFGGDEVQVFLQGLHRHVLQVEPESRPGSDMEVRVDVGAMLSQ